MGLRADRGSARTDVFGAPPLNPFSICGFILDRGAGEGAILGLLIMIINIIFAEWLFPYDGETL